MQCSRAAQAAPAAAAHLALAAQRPRRPTAGLSQLPWRSQKSTARCIAAAEARRPAAAPPAALSAAAEQQQRAPQQQLADPGELPPLLTGVRIVLVSPKTPANIGAVLRVAENFEAHDVVVVDPRCDSRCDEVAVTSCFSPLLHRLRVVPTLADALADCTGSIGFTRRAGGGRLVHASMRQLLTRFPAAIPALLLPPHSLRHLADAAAAEGAAAAAETVGETASSSHPSDTAAAATTAATAGPNAVGPAAAAPGTVALVFGREESGLLENELLLCSHACAIPTGRTQPSLNLSHAVAVIASQLFDLQQQRLMAECLGDEEQQRVEQQQQAEQQQGQQQAAQPAAEQGQQQQQAANATLLSGSLLTGSLFESERVRWQREQALTGASMAELEALLQRAAALLEAAGISAKESIGGGDKSNHGRRKQLMGHVRSLLLRSQASTAEVRALHGLCKELERRQAQQQQQQRQQ